MIPLNTVDQPAIEIIEIPESILPIDWPDDEEDEESTEDVEMIELPEPEETWKRKQSTPPETPADKSPVS
jgi:hypothetical protein